MVGRRQLNIPQKWSYPCQAVHRLCTQTFFFIFCGPTRYNGLLFCSFRFLFAHCHYLISAFHFSNKTAIYIKTIIYTIFQEGDTFGMKAILPCGPLNIKHMKNKLYTYIKIANTNSAHCLSYGYYLKYETINMFSCLCCIWGKKRM